MLLRGYRAERPTVTEQHSAVVGRAFAVRRPGPTLARPAGWIMCRLAPTTPTMVLYRDDKAGFPMTRRSRPAPGRFRAGRDSCPGEIGASESSGPRISGPEDARNRRSTSGTPVTRFMTCRVYRLPRAPHTLALGSTSSAAKGHPVSHLGAFERTLLSPCSRGRCGRLLRKPYRLGGVVRPALVSRSAMGSTSRRSARKTPVSASRGAPGASCSWGSTSSAQADPGRCAGSSA